MRVRLNCPAKQGSLTQIVWDESKASSWLSKARVLLVGQGWLLTVITKYAQRRIAAMRSIEGI
jgi:hypothetical protein